MDFTRIEWNQCMYNNMLAAIRWNVTRGAFETCEYIYINMIIYAR